MSFTETIRRVLQLKEINAEISDDPAAFIRAECDHYRDSVQEVCARLNDQNVRRRVLLLAGPSSSGKTTTANLLCDGLRRGGMDAFVVSLDDFYRGRGLAPQLPDGSFDYESPEALDLPQLAACIRSLLEDGRAMIPQYDFKAGTPKAEKAELVLTQRAVVIFEGIHALSPALVERLPTKHVKKLFIHTHSRFYDGEEMILSRRETRLVRRMVRDEKHRGTAAAQTLSMWPQVLHGEETYLFPYADVVDMTIDTTHAFEPCMLAAQALPMLREIPLDHPHRKTAQHLIEALEGFCQVPHSLLPPDCILHEFLQ